MQFGSAIPAGLLAVSIAIAGCSVDADVSIGGKSLDREGVEETISTGLGEQAQLPAPEVDCEGIEDIDVEQGSTFTCTGTAPNGETFPINVTLTDDDGGYRYQVPEDVGSETSERAR